MLNEGATLLVANAGWEDGQYEAIGKAAIERDITLVWYRDVGELINYINTGRTDGKGDHRTNDPVTLFYVFAHGTDGGTGNYAIEFGLYTGVKNMSLKTENIGGIYGSAFSDGAMSVFYTCRTGNTFSGNGNFAQTWVNKTDSITYAFRGLFNFTGRTDYEGINGNTLQSQADKYGQYWLVSQKYEQWLQKRGGVEQRPGEAWRLPSASILSFLEVFSKRGK
jgi:hypothetical protein